MLLTHPTTAMATASDTTMNSTNKLLATPTYPLPLSLSLSFSPASILTKCSYYYYHYYYIRKLGCKWSGFGYSWIRPNVF